MDNYDILKSIGSGTFSRVLLVRSTLGQQNYVVKEIYLKSMSQEERRQALNEAQIISKLKHGNIIRHKEAWIDENEYLNVVMEYAEGGDLYTAIINQKGVHFTEHRILTWFIQICLALQYIHSKNILHGDLKSSNIYLTHNQIIKVGDFAIARVMKGPEVLIKNAVGTPYYMAPEVFQRKLCSYKRDMWSLGCVLFEMTALDHAFKGNDFLQLADSVIKGRRQNLPRNCSRFIKEMVDALLKFNPEERPSTVEILEKPTLQPYLREFVASQSTKDNFLPFLTGQCEEIEGLSANQPPRHRSRSPSPRPLISDQEPRLEHETSNQNGLFQSDGAERPVSPYYNNNTNGGCSQFANQTHEFRTRYCTHSQCHTCMLDSLWKNRTQRTAGSVNVEEYYKLRSQLRQVYKERLFEKVHRSLNCYYYGTKDPALEKQFQEIMKVMNNNQVENLSLMVQLVQLHSQMKFRN